MYLLVPIITTVQKSSYYVSLKYTLLNKNTQNENDSYTVHLNNCILRKF